MMKRVKISRYVIEEMLTTGYTVERLEVMQGLPPGARLAFVDTHEATDSITLMFDVPDDGRNTDEDVEIFIRQGPLPYERPAALPSRVF